MKMHQAGNLVSLYDFIYPHNPDGCEGTFQFKIVPNQPYMWHVLNKFDYFDLEMVACETCQAAYYVAGFERRIELIKVQEVLAQIGPLTHQETRFLRLATGKSAKEMADFLGLNILQYNAAEKWAGLDESYRQKFSEYSLE